MYISKGAGDEIDLLKDRFEWLTKIVPDGVCCGDFNEKTKFDWMSEIALSLYLFVSISNK